MMTLSLWTMNRTRQPSRIRSSRDFSINRIAILEFLLLMATAAAPSGFAQTASTGALAGKIIDATSAVVPSVQIAVILRYTLRED